MPTYTVKSPVRRQGRTHRPGETVELEGREAERLLALGAVAEAESKNAGGGAKKAAKGSGKEE